MSARTLLACSLSLVFTACGGSKEAAPTKADPAAAKAQEEAALQAKLEERKKARLAEEEAKKKAEEDVKKKIQEVTVIPEGTKIPKAMKDACEMVVKAQEGFMKRFHPATPDGALTTQLGLLRKQCMDMKTPAVAVCQKFALDATTDELKAAINEYLPVCMEKYEKG